MPYRTNNHSGKVEDLSLPVPGCMCGCSIETPCRRLVEEGKLKQRDVFKPLCALKQNMRKYHRNTKRKNYRQ